jgi:hypothetical protein
MPDTITYSGQLVVLSCWCGIRHAVPSQLRNHQQSQQDNGEHPDSIYCPLGHQHVPSGEGKAAKLERRLQREREERARVTAEREQAEASARAYKGSATKARKRAAAALCPCCNRSFVQLRRHMAAKHPDYDPAI